MKLELTCVDRQKPSIELQQFPVIFGLDPGADVCLDDSSVGHYQCMIDRCDGGLMVWDLGTKLGTTINGVRICKKAPLLPGDELGIGKNRFIAHYEDDGEAMPRHQGHVGARPAAPAHRRRRPTASV
jgi:hypothetical protein